MTTETIQSMCQVWHVSSVIEKTAEEVSLVATQLVHHKQWEQVRAVEEIVFMQFMLSATLAILGLTGWRGAILAEGSVQFNFQSGHSKSKSQHLLVLGDHPRPARHRRFQSKKERPGVVFNHCMLFLFSPFLTICHEIIRALIGE